MDINEKITFWKNELERAKQYDFVFDIHSMEEVINTIVEQQEKIEKLQKMLGAKIMFVSNGMEEDMYALQEKIIRYKKALKYYADRGFNKAKEALKG